MDEDKPLEFSVVSDLGPRMRNQNLKVKCESISEVREVSSKSDGSMHRVTEALIGDETASILLTVWDDTIDRIEIGKSYTIKNSYTSIFRGSLRLNLGKYGELEDSTEEISEINTENNLSDKIYESPRRGPRRGGYSGRSFGQSRDYSAGYRRRNPRDRRGGSGKRRH
ncbi:MAG: hypothetical protein ACTSVY_10125 [Candidatus Helarchaeota archaeon]